MSRSLLVVILTAVLLLEFGNWVPKVSSTRISIADNGYSNIVVAIHPDVPETDAQEIMNNIQTMIRRASSVLYRATKQRAYYKDVRILIPSSWVNIPADECTWETYSTADVQVAPPGGSHGDVPYTVQSGGCGQPGEYIHLTPGYLSTIGQPDNTANYGPAEKVFVYEWSRLRYGVFEEFGQKGNKLYPLFYKPDSYSKEIPNLCTDKPPSFTVQNLNTKLPCKVNIFGEYASDCVYILDRDFSPASSLMSLYSVDSVVEFCDDGTHNNKAKTKHNAMCESKAVWTIISEHPDFKNNNNPPRNVANLEPSFNIVRCSSSRFVLVMDTSGSMDYYNRITRLHDSAMRWINYDISNGSQLGLVEFSSAGRILSNLILIKDQKSRDSLIARLPTFTSGATCIGCGLLKALEILKPTEAGVIVLITDGEENEWPMISHVLQQIIDAKVRVVSIAFGRLAENEIENLAKQTNGKSYFIDDTNPDSSLHDAFYGSLTYQPAIPSNQIVVTLFQKSYQSVTSGTISDSFPVDSTVGRNLKIRIDYTYLNDLVSFQLTSPSGTVYTQLKYDFANKLAVFELSFAEVGNWQFTLTVTNPMYGSLAVQVTSLSSSTTTVPITTECSVPNANPVVILAKVMQGNTPVIKAKVQAYVEIPDGTLQIIDLFDNGLPADTTVDDGIYSRYFPFAIIPGRYTVLCQVWNDESTYIKDGFIATRNGRQENPKEIGPFARVADGGSFKITYPVPEFNGTNDYYPPSRVIDLLVVQANDLEMNKSITIQFTAPGDELDWGTAFKYEIRYSTEFDDLLPDHFNLVGNSTLVQPEHIINGSLQPSPSGSKELIAFTVNTDSLMNTTYFIAVRAIDRVGQIGRASNIVSALFPSQKQCQPSW